MNKKIIKIVEILLTVLLVGFIFVKAGDFFDTVQWDMVIKVWPQIVSAGIIFAIGYTIFAHHWLLVCRIIKPDTPSKQHLAFFASQPYKYLPTSLFTLSFRAKFSSQLGMKLRDSSEAQIIENLNLVGGALLIGAIMVSSLYSLSATLAMLVLMIVIAFLAWKQHTITIPRVKNVINLRKWISAFLVVLLGWITVGCGFMIVVIGIDQVINPLAAIGANSIATGLGILAIFAPGGIGVRELVFSFFMYSSTTIIIWRFVTFIVDIVLGLTSMMLIAKRH